MVRFPVSRSSKRNVEQVARATLIEMTFNPAAALCEVLREHGIHADLSDEGVSVLESDLFVSAYIVKVTQHPNTKAVQLDVRVSSKRLIDRVVVESFAGWAPEEDEAAKQAFEKFMRASLHVLLAVLVEPRLGENQAEWETWRFGEDSWRVCIGPVILQGAPPKPFICGELLNRLRDQLLPRLGGVPHWVRLYFWRYSEQQTGFEALLDNLDWPDGRNIGMAWDWPEGAYSARLFLMLTPASNY
jgi:hypothetical protein